MTKAKSDYVLAGKRIWVAGHRGLVGSALVRRLEREDCEILTVSRSKCDLRDPAQVDRWMGEARVDAIFLAAAQVGGILANDSRPVAFLYDNMLIQNTVIEAARKFGVEKLMFLGSSCIYPRMAPQPIAESALLTGPLEPTNQWYALAKIAGIKLCQAYRRQYGCDFISVMPTNLYGPSDNFDLLSSHVVPGLMAKVHQAKECGAREIEVWGTGKPKREFLHVDDAADGMVFLMKHYSEDDIINLGTGNEITIADLASLMCRVVGFRGGVRFDPAKPDGTPRKVLDLTRLHGLGWRARISLTDGLQRTYRWYLEQGQPSREQTLVHA
jgi:GDP-L-fucose synthase